MSYKNSYFKSRNSRKFLTHKLFSRRTINYIIVTITFWLIEVKGKVKHTVEIWGTQSKYYDFAWDKRENVGENRMRAVMGTQSCLPGWRRWILSPVVRRGMDWYTDTTIPLIWLVICEVINYATVHFLVRTVQSSDTGNCKIKIFFIPRLCTFETSSFALKIEAAGSSEMSRPFYQTTWRHIPENPRSWCSPLRDPQIN